MLTFDALLPQLAEFLPAQRWYGGTKPPKALDLVHGELERSEWPALCPLVVRADGAYYQVLVGLRPTDEHPDFLRGRDHATLGHVDTELGPAQAYEATLDPELGLTLLDVVGEGRWSAHEVRAAGNEQSNSSLIYDNQLMLKMFRRLQPGPNPEIEVTRSLEAVGFTHLPSALATRSWQDFDLAVLQPFLAGGVEGWALALTSLRDLFGVHDTQPVPMITDAAAPPPPPPDPADAGGDFSGEADRLGATTADMHLAMAEAFGRNRGDAQAWADVIAAQAAEAPVPAALQRGVDTLLDDLRRVADAGSAIRVHGDYHLGQVMRTDAGWFVLDFEGEPLRPLEERRRPSSPLRDVAGMLRSFHYASMVALADRDEVGLAESWASRNRQAFLDGYHREVKRGGLLPADRASTETVLRAFELEKAVYELRYEEAHRPQWAGIPRAALARLATSRS
jgi:maltokinase